MFSGADCSNASSRNGESRDGRATRDQPDDTGERERKMAAEVPPTATSSATRKRFSVEDDLDLLKEVRGCCPFENPAKWVIVVSNLNKARMKDFTVRAVRERCDYLLRLFAEEDRRNLRK